MKIFQMIAILVLGFTGCAPHGNIAGIQIVNGNINIGGASGGRSVTKCRTTQPVCITQEPVHHRRQVPFRHESKVVCQPEPQVVCEGNDVWVRPRPTTPSFRTSQPVVRRVETREVVRERVTPQRPQIRYTPRAQVVVVQPQPRPRRYQQQPSGCQQQRIIIVCPRCRRPPHNGRCHR